MHWSKLKPATFANKWFPSPPHPKELLMFLFTTSDFSGVAEGLEGQPVKWVDPQDLVDKYDMADVGQVFAEWLLAHIGPDGHLQH